jgi:hypothetical protein
LGPPARPDRMALMEPMARLVLRAQQDRQARQELLGPRARRGRLELPARRVRSVRQVLLGLLALQGLSGLQVLQE